MRIKKSAVIGAIMLGVILLLSSNLMAQNSLVYPERVLRTRHLIVNETGIKVGKYLRETAGVVQSNPNQSLSSLFERDPKNEAERVAKAMGIVETGGVAKAGASGETKSIWQWLPATWQSMSQKYNEEVNGVKASLPLNCATEQKVVVWKCQKFLRRGYTPKEIGMIWNSSLGGQEKPLVRKGINKYGVPYDSEHHGEKVQHAFNLLVQS